MNLKWVLLEIKLPEQVDKTPEAMEIILGNIFFQGGGVGSWNDRVWSGKLLAYTTLEITSIGGNVHFYIRSEAKFKNLIETQIYSQYPRAEVIEVEDYTKNVPMFDRRVDNGWSCRAFEFKLDGADALPIKTYIDHGLDKTALQLEDQQRLDPMTPMLEMMASLKPGENLWIQIFIRAFKDLEINKIKDGKYKKDIITRTLGNFVDDGEKFLHLENKDKSRISWQDEGKEEIKKLIETHSTVEVVEEKGKDGKPDKMKKIGGYKNLSPMDKHKVDIIQRSIMKVGFSSGMRAVYYAPKDSFNGMRVPVELTSAMRQFADPGYNQLIMDGGTFTRAWDFPWQDPTERRSLQKEENMFKAYVKRAYYYHEAEGEIFDKPKKLFTLNTEELATIFHFPGKTVSSPSFTRVDSQKAAAPENLPI